MVFAAYGQSARQYSTTSAHVSPSCLASPALSQKPACGQGAVYAAPAAHLYTAQSPRPTSSNSANTRSPVVAPGCYAAASPTYASGLGYAKGGLVPRMATSAVSAKMTGGQANLMAGHSNAIGGPFSSGHTQRLLKSSPLDRSELNNAVVVDESQASKPPAVALAEALKSTLPPLALGPKAEFVMPRGKARCGLVWMHGLGDTEEGWAENMEEEFAIPRDVGPCKYILPRAPVQAVSCNGGDRMTSWFDMRKLPLRSTDLPPRHDCSLEQALASCGRIHAAIQKLIDEGIPAERIVVGGFSQGGAMAVLSALTFPQRLAGVIVFSGIIFYGDMLAQLVTPITKDLPFFWGHGTADEVLHISLQEEGAQLLADCGFKVVTKQYPVPHSSHQEEFKEAASFFASVVGAAETGGK